jgi:hypothetical protein
MTDSQVLLCGVVSLQVSLLLSMQDPWEMPARRWRDGRPSGDHSHWLGFCYWAFRLNTWCLCRFLRFLSWLRIPGRWLNLVQSPLPRFILRAGACEYMRRHPEFYGQKGGLK